MSIRKTWAGLAVAVAIACSAGMAHADARETQATELFRAGAAAYAKGEFRAAAQAFEAAHRAIPRGAAIHNAGLSWLAAGERSRAADALAQGLSIGLSASDEARARQELTTLERSLGVVHVVGTPGARFSVEHVVDATPPLDVHLEPGAHEITLVRATGERTKQTVQIAAGARIELDTRPASPPPTAPPPTAPPPPSSDGSSQRIIGFVTAGAGVVTGGVAVVLGLNALAARDDFEASGQTSASARSKASDLRLATNLCWAGAAALGATGLVLVLTAPSGSGGSHVGIGPTGASWTTRF